MGEGMDFYDYYTGVGSIRPFVFLGGWRVGLLQFFLMKCVVVLLYMCGLAWGGVVWFVAGNLDGEVAWGGIEVWCC